MAKKEKGKKRKKKKEKKDTVLTVRKIFDSMSVPQQKQLGCLAK